MDITNCGNKKNHRDCKCSCTRYNCPECGCMVTTKFVYICRTVRLIENRAFVSVGNTIFWSNKVVAKKITEHPM